MFPGWVLQVRKSAVCGRLGVGWLFAVWVQCGPLCWDSLDALRVRAVLVVMMRVIGVNVHDEMNEMYDFVGVDVLPVSCLCIWIKDTTDQSGHSGTCYTRLMGFGLGSWKESSLSLLPGFFFFAPLGGLEMMICHDTVASNGLSFSCTFYRLGLQSCTSILIPDISDHCPCQPLQFCTVLLSAERTWPVLSPSELSHPWLGELGRSVLFASVEFLVVMSVDSRDVDGSVMSGHDSSLCGPSM